jgi:signal transduction histidine kinase
VDPCAPTPSTTQRWIAGAIALGLAVALVALVAPGVRLAYRDPSADGAVQAASAITAALAAALLAGRARRTGSSNDVVLAASLGVLALCHVLLVILPRVVGSGDGIFDPWLLLLGRLLGAAGLFAALAWSVLRARPAGDGLVPWLGCAAALAVVSWLRAPLFGALSPSWWTSAAALLLASHVVVLAGAVHDHVDAQGQLAQEGIRAERRRLAREIHDGLAQELAFIARESMRLEPSQHKDRIRDAADRALAESRLAIAMLAAAVDQPLPALLRDAAESVAVRAGATVLVEGTGGEDVSPEERRALMRIVREAASNGVRHGGARTIRLAYEAGRRPMTVRISDDGSGFDLAATPRATAFGLDVMRERAEALGGRVEVRSAPGRGTDVEVSIP